MDSKGTARKKSFRFSNKLARNSSPLSFPPPSPPPFSSPSPPLLNSPPIPALTDPEDDGPGVVDVEAIVVDKRH